MGGYYYDGMGASVSGRVGAGGGGGGSGTFGDTAIEASSNQLSNNFKQVWKFTNSQAGAVVSKLTVRLSGHATGVNLVKGVIYTDSSGPNALSATSAEYTLAAAAAEAWVDLTFSSPPTLAAGDYWLGFIVSSAAGAGLFRCGAVASSRRYSNDTYSDGATNPFGAPTTDGVGPCSIYATYTY